MKAMLSAFVVMAVMAIGADQILDRAGFGADERSAGPSVRLD